MMYTNGVSVAKVVHCKNENMVLSFVLSYGGIYM